VAVIDSWQAHDTSFMYDILNVWIAIPFIVLTKPHVGAMCWAVSCMIS
jgi:hypothetical protein